MAVCPFARWEPVTGHSDGPMRSQTGLVLHVNDADSYDLHDFIQASNDVSSHFQIGKDGVLFQYIDTTQQAWCQGTGNPDYLSVETEGLVSELMTAAQVATLARLVAWVHAVHGMPLALADVPGQRGLGWHGMGAANGQPGWGHPDCPGVRKDQRAQVLTAAGAVGVLSGSDSQIVEGFMADISQADFNVLMDGYFSVTGRGRVQQGVQQSNVEGKLDALAAAVAALAKKVDSPAVPLGGPHNITGTLVIG